VIAEEQLEHALYLLQGILECFTKRGRWISHKDNDGQVVDVSEDLHDYLAEATEFLEVYGE
jgi:hypothetical protein